MPEMTSLQKRTAETLSAQRTPKTNVVRCAAKHTFESGNIILRGELRAAAVQSLFCGIRTRQEECRETPKTKRRAMRGEAYV